MDHRDHVNLIRKGVPEGIATWADVGCGTGAFTLALAECLGAGATIYGVDVSERALRNVARRMASQFRSVQFNTLCKDFCQPLLLPALDGIVAANSLHFVHDKLPVLKQLRKLLKPGGRFVIVEYDTDQGNYAVPHPLTYAQWDKLALAAGFADTQLLATRPSRFLGSFFSALSVNSFEIGG